MANLDVLPDTGKQMPLVWSKGAAYATGFQIKVVPKNIDGTIFDCSTVNGATLNFPTPKPTSPTLGATQAMTLGTGDATGQILSLTAAQANTLAGNLLSNNQSVSIQLSTSGGDALIAALGNLTLSINP